MVDPVLFSDGTGAIIFPFLPHFFCLYIILLLFELKASIKKQL